MPDEIRKVDHFFVRIPHKAGEGGRLLAALQKEGVNLLGAWGYQKTKTQALMELVPESASALKAASKKLKIALEPGQACFYVTGEDRPGAVAEWMTKLGEAGVNAIAMQAAAAGGGRYGALLYVSRADAKKAAKALGVV